MTLSLSGLTCSSNKVAAASPASERSHGQKLQGNAAPTQTGKQSAKRSSKRQSRATASAKHTESRGPEGTETRVSGAEQLQARSRHRFLCSGRWGNMKAETRDNEKINDQRLSCAKTHYLSCSWYQLECDALMANWGRSKTKKKQKSKPIKNFYAATCINHYSDLH